MSILFLADTHLGFDQPVRPRVRRRRRGPDFLASFRRVLTRAVDARVDLVVHGGDLFFRSRVPDDIVDLVYGELLSFAEHGIPLVVVPGNHERSRLPSSLFLQHPEVHVFDRPRTFLLDTAGVRLALGGFPNVRHDVRRHFSRLLDETELADAAADIRLLCVHQTIEGATVGPSGHVFRRGRDVIRQRDLPRYCDAVLAGHIHRHQVLEVPNGGGVLPVIYPGATERTSFAEANETKGCSLITFERASGPWALARHRFVPLPTRPMVTIDVPPDLSPSGLHGFLARVARETPPDAIVRFRRTDAASHTSSGLFTTEQMAAHLPQTMNVQFAAGFFDRGRRRATP
ncbi:MAG: metallophosphoesterase [Candidatus Eisenbacteria bacterium]|nr:metallophosphoesterase [Candidatus Eisenbacteria bacterium]